MQGVMFIVLLITVILVSLVVRRAEERRIEGKIETIGGKLITIEYRRFFSGPFLVLNRVSSVYRFEYSQENQIKKGWVKFGLFSSDWKFK